MTTPTEQKSESQRYLEFLIAIEAREAPEKWATEIQRIQVENARLRYLLDESRKMQTIIQADGTRYVEEIRLLRKLEEWVVREFTPGPIFLTLKEILDALKKLREKSNGN